MSKKEIVETLNILDEALNYYVKLIKQITTEEQFDILMKISDKIWEAKDVLNNSLFTN